MFCIDKLKTTDTRGMTLIEILIVVAIIGLLSTLVLVGTNKAMEKTRDNTRKADLYQIKLALDLYRDKKGYLPIPSSYGENDASSTDLSIVDGDNDGTKWLDFLKDEGVMNTVVVDPKNCNMSTCGGDYYYRYLYYDSTAGCGRPFVVIQAMTLESDASGIDSRGNISCRNCSGCSFLDNIDTGYTIQIFD